MAAMIFSSADLSSSRRRRAAKHATTMIQPNIQFQPLDPDIVSASIPAFFIGRNRAGFWVARETEGRIGGLFLFKSSAVEFAKTESAAARCALIFPSETIELDVDNRGNPLTAQLVRATDQARRWLARFAAE